jgi:hypothetical protein
MDDFSMFGNSFDHYLSNLEKILKWCIEVNLVLSWEKSHFMVQEGIILSHIVSHRGIEVDRAKVDLISKLPPPSSVRQIRSFLGHVGFYRRFIKDFSKLSKPLTDLLANDALFHMTSDCIQAYHTLRGLVSTSLVFHPPDWS